MLVSGSVIKVTTEGVLVTLDNLKETPKGTPPPPVILAVLPVSQISQKRLFDANQVMRNGDSIMVRDHG
jgi:hypothetical protein